MHSIIEEWIMSRMALSFIISAAISLLATQTDSASAQSIETVSKPAANFCVFADRSYSKGATICFGPRLSLECGDDQRWKPVAPGGGGAGDLVVICRDAPFPKLDNVGK